MPSEAYQRLVRTGYVSTLKREILLDASRDLEYISNIPGLFFDAGAGAADEPISCAADLIEDLLQTGLCLLATSVPGYGSKPVAIQPTRAELEVHLSDMTLDPWEFFLIATPLGNEWVQRYLTLVSELDAPSERRTLAVKPVTE